MACSLDVKFDIIDFVRNEALNSGHFTEVSKQFIEAKNSKEAKLFSNEMNLKYGEDIVSATATSIDTYFIDPSNKLVDKYYKDHLNRIANDANQQEIGEDYEPVEEGTLNFDTETRKEEAPKESVDTIVKRFLEKIGVSIQAVDQIRNRKGELVNATAKADMLNKIIQVIEDKQSIDTLPEEAAHFFVEMLGPGHPLYKEMFDKITGYKIYTDTLEQYKNKYRNQDGTINFNKIKKEAIGKMIAEVIVNKNVGSESEAKLKEAVSWFQKLWNFIKSAFDKVSTNPFEEAADLLTTDDIQNILSNSPIDEEYYQLTDPMEGLLQDQDKLTLDNSIDPITQQKRHIYKYNLKDVKASVTSWYVDKWLKKKFPNDNRSFRQKEIDLLKAEFGDVIHTQIQDIIKSWTNLDGTKKDVQDVIAPVTSPAIYKKLNDYMQELLNSYEEGTIFKAEMKIYDQKNDIAGSIDLIVQDKNGVVDIYDWKSQEIGKEQTDIKGYKEPMYRIQLENYRKILQLQYGFQKFGKIRAIPIGTTINITGNNKLLTGIEIGDRDTSKIPDEKSYLFPVTLKTESTGNTQLDDLITKLNGIYDKIENTRSYSGEDLYKKREELAKFRVVLRDLMLNQRIDRLVELGLLEFKKYSEKLDTKTLTGKDISEALKILDVFGESGVMLYDLREEMFNAMKESGDPKQVEAFKKTNELFSKMTSRVSKLIKDITLYRDEQTKEIGEKNGIFNLLNPEVAVGTLKGLFGSLSNIKQKSFRLFSKLLRAAQNYRDNNFDEMAAKLKDYKNNLATWASSKSMTQQQAMDMMLEIDDKGNWNGNFLRKFNPNFKIQRLKAIEEGDEDWFKTNTQFDDEAYKKAEKQQIEFFKTMSYVLDEKQNAQIIEDKIGMWKMSHNLFTETGGINLRALANENNYFLKPVDSWLTTKWQTLHKKNANGDYVNKPVVDAYEYFQSLTRYSEKLGMLDKFSPTFIPSMFSSKMDQLVFGDVKGLFSAAGIFEKLQLDSGTQYSPEVDPTDGSIINRIPVYFTRDMGIEQKDGTVDFSKKSRDLFKVFGVWGAHMYNYEAMQQIEDDSHLILETERNKESIVTDTLGNIVNQNGETKSTNENKRNTELLGDFINYYLYDRLSGKGADKAIKIGGKEYSAIKSMRSAISWFSFKTLALNWISGTSQFVGGTGNALFISRKGVSFTTSQWAKAMYEVGANKKSMPALKFLNILQEGNQRNLIDDLSISKTNQLTKKDNFFIIQRLADKGVQYPVAIALLRNHMLDEKTGNIVDISKFVKNEFGYDATFYNLSSKERAEMKQKIEARVTELMDTKSLMEIGKLNEKGEFSIPGVDKNSVTFSDFKSKIKALNKKIIGNSSRDDVNKIRTTMLGAAVMQFRNWLPEMVEERLDGLRYDDELQIWTYGKLNQFMSDLFSSRFPLLVKAIVTGLGDNAILLAKEKYQIMKRDAFEKGEDFTLSEAEFIDMHVGNLKSQIAELLVFLSFGAAILSIVGAGGGDDPDKRHKGMKAYLARALNKYYNEFAFFYNPLEFTKIVSNPVPFLGLADDFARFTGAVGKEAYGAATGNEALKKQAKPMKYLFKMVPVAKEGLLMMATFSDEFRREWDIKLQSGAGGFH